MPKQPLSAPKPPRIPAYCHHRTVGQAYVRIGGKQIYLGTYGSEASRTAYAAVIADVLAGRDVVPRRPRGQEAGPHRATVREVATGFKRFAGSYYVKDGRQTAEVGMVASAVDHAVALFGDQPADSFGPVALKAVRDRMVAHGWARSTVNGGVSRIRRAFKWAAADELIPAGVPTALATVDGLRAGRTEAREPAPILPVGDDVIERTVAELPEVLGDMVRLQRLTGMRPGEVCTLRPYDIDRTQKVWEYRPESHKTEHHGRERVVYLGPKAQALLLRYLARDPESCCFRPTDSEAKRRALAHALRTTPLSCGNRPGTNAREEPARRPGERYSVNAYRQAIGRACRRAGVERWRPNQLRHTAATEVRARFGLEAAQVTLGHSTARTSEIYAEKNQAAGAAVAQAIG